MRLSPSLPRRAALAAPLAFAACAKGGGFAGACPGRPVGEVPMVPVQGAWVVPVRINGQDWGMALDTGAGFSTLARPAAERLKLNIYGKYEAVVGGVGGFQRGGFAEIDRFAFAGIDLHGVLMPVTDLSLPPFDLLPMAGLLGMPNLWVFDMQFDFPGQTLRLYNRADCDNPKPDWDGPYTDVPIRTVQSEPSRNRNVDVNSSANRTADRNTADVGSILLDVAVNGRAFTALLDTGAGRTTINADAASLAGMSTAGTPVRSSDANGAVLEQTRVSGNGVRVGSMTWTDVPLDITPGRLAYGVDMLFGQDLMRDRRVWAMLGRKRLFLQRA